VQQAPALHSSPCAQAPAGELLGLRSPAPHAPHAPPCTCFFFSHSPPATRNHACQQTVDQAYDYLREKNTGKTLDGKTFGEVMDCFIIGGDETCLLASDGDVRIIGDKEKVKHQVAASESRNSITVYIWST
jgi:hypothetical protein|tara:strand:- start:98 stop:490 length:393 start_codon:yes stop_codon:yes gene_type:complete